MSWVYRCLVEGLFGVKGDVDGLRIQPQLPADWARAEIQREFRGAWLDIAIKRTAVTQQQVWLDGRLLDGNYLVDLVAGQHYNVEVHLPE